MTTQETKRLTATAIIANDFMFKCFESGMSSEEAQDAALLNNDELQSMINGLSEAL